MAPRIKFETILKRRSRITVPGISPETMAQIGQSAITSIQHRLLRAQDIYDASAPPLSKKYAGWKGQRYGSMVRDLHASGRTFRGMKVLQAGLNYAILGFSDPVALKNVKVNKRWSVQWGISPVNFAEIQKAADEAWERPKVVSYEKVA